MREIRTRASKPGTPLTGSESNTWDDMRMLCAIVTASLTFRHVLVVSEFAIYM